VTLDRKPFYHHVMTSRDDLTSASRPQTLMSPSSMTPPPAASAADVAAAAASWSSFGGGRTFPRRGEGTGAGTLQPARRRIADVGHEAGRVGRATPPTAPRSHSRSYSDLLSDDHLSPPPPPPPLDLDEPRGGVRARTSSSAKGGLPRGGAHRGDGGSWTLDRHRSTVTPACAANDVIPRACVVDCRQTGYPVFDV